MYKYVYIYYDIWILVIYILCWFILYVIVIVYCRFWFNWIYVFFKCLTFETLPFAFWLSGYFFVTFTTRFLLDDLFSYPLPFWEICLKLFANIQQGYLNVSMQSPAVLGCCVAVATLVGYLIINSTSMIWRFRYRQAGMPCTGILKGCHLFELFQSILWTDDFCDADKIVPPGFPVGNTHSWKHSSGHIVAPSNTTVFVLRNFRLNDCSCIPCFSCVLPCVSICFESTISTSSYLRPTCRSVWLCVFPVPK